MKQQTTGPTFALVNSKVHTEILKAIAKSGIDLTDADAILVAYTMSLTQFFLGLKKEGHSRNNIDGWIDWIAENVKFNVNSTNGIPTI